MPLTGESSPQIPSLKYDQDATNKFKIELRPNGIVELQFPPKITSDSKSSSWVENHYIGFEEFAYWKGSYARKVNIELNYVIWGKWDHVKIAKNVRKLKWHLYVGGGDNAVGEKMPFFYMSGWKVIDGSSVGVPTFRLMNISAEYSKEYVGSGVDYWPLHTKVNLECKLFTGTGASEGDPQFRTLKDYTCGDLPGLAYEEWA